jgi:alpha-1,2-mannosyltransferase
MRKLPAIEADGSAGVTWRGIVPASYVAVAALIVYLSVWGRRYGLDLSVYRDATLYWRSGHDPYLTNFGVHHLAFTYPPFAFLVLSPLSWPSFAVAEWVLWAASIAAATGSVILILRERGLGIRPIVWCQALVWSCAAGIMLEPARSALDYGQIEFILMFAVVADLLLVPRRYRGILIGVAAAVKLTPLIFAAFLIANRDVQSSVRAAVTFVGCTAISWMFWPQLSRVYWLHEMSMRPASELLPIAAINRGMPYSTGHRSLRVDLHSHGCCSRLS